MVTHALPTHLISLPREGDLLPVLHPLVDGDLEDLPLPDHLAAGALLAPQLGVDALPLAVALGAHRLDLLHHAGTKLLDADLHTEERRRPFFFFYGKFFQATYSKIRLLKKKKHAFSQNKIHFVQ